MCFEHAKVPNFTNGPLCIIFYLYHRYRDLQMNKDRTSNVIQSETRTIKIYFTSKETLFAQLATRKMTVHLE